MTARTTAQLGFGLLGLWAAIQAVAMFPGLAVMASAITATSGFVPVVFAIILPVAFLMVMSYLLLFHNARLTAQLFPGVEEESKAETADVPRVLVGLAGVLLLGLVVPHIVRVIPGLGGPAAVTASVERVQTRELISAALQLALALYLIFRPGKFLELWIA